MRRGNIGRWHAPHLGSEPELQAVTLKRVSAPTTAPAAASAPAAPAVAVATATAPAAAPAPTATALVPGWLLAPVGGKGWSKLTVSARHHPSSVPEPHILADGGEHQRDHICGLASLAFAIARPAWLHGYGCSGRDFHVDHEREAARGVEPEAGDGVLRLLSVRAFSIQLNPVVVGACLARAPVRISLRDHHTQAGESARARAPQDWC